MNKQICLLSFLGLAAMSCSNEAKLAGAAVPARTVLVYLAGDNSLSDEVGTKTEALVAGWHNTQDNLLIYRDGRDADGTPSLLKVEADALHPYAKVVKEYPESNSAASEIFSEVLRDVTVRAHSGLTTYIEQSAYPSLNVAWRQTPWGKIKTWQEK